MPTDDTPSEQSFQSDIERLLGRPLDADEARLAASLRHDKSAAIVARELEGSVIADPKKIRPEHSDAANE